jgi:dTDP-4-amino-4,6-dideoxy-D-galactose acyltransferase
MNNYYDILEWDSLFFGYKVASIHPSKLVALDLNSLLRELSNSKVKLAYFFVDPSDEVSMNSIANASGLLVDEKVTYYIEGFKGSEAGGASLIRSYDKTYPSESLKELALQSGQFSRFKLDPNFKNNEFENLYFEWINSSVKKRIADEILVYYDNNVEKGFVTLAVKKDRGSIGLIAVDQRERGKSVGRNLINESYAFFIKQNINMIEVVTQKANIGACHFYESLGFEVKSIINIFHLWIK